MCYDGDSDPLRIGEGEGVITAMPFWDLEVQHMRIIHGRERFDRWKWMILALVMVALATFFPLHMEAYAATRTCTTIEDAGSELRGKMKQRKAEIEVVYQTHTPDSDVVGLGERIKAEAFKYTGDPQEGDYILMNVGNVHTLLNYQGQANTHTYRFTFNVTYYDTKIQEDKLTKKLPSVIKSLGLKKSDTEYKKVRTIYDYVCKNVTYDWENVDRADYDLKFTAYAALMRGTAVCSGYSLLMYRLLLESGVDARIVEGIGGSGLHSWNIVKIGKLYYCLDATWDSETYSGIDNVKFFLKGETAFSANHTRVDGRYAFTGKKYKTEFPTSNVDYVPVTGCSHRAVADKAVKATFTKTGLTKGSHCAGCGKVLKKQKVISMKTGLRKISGKTYFYKNGKKQTGWQKVGKKKYFFSSKTKTMKIGWARIDKHYYYFGKTAKTLGQMVTGKLKIGKKVYRFKKNGVCLDRS